MNMSGSERDDDDEDDPAVGRPENSTSHHALCSEEQLLLSFLFSSPFPAVPSRSPWLRPACHVVATVTQ